MFSFLAWQYLIGSVLFLVGGIFNYWRAYLVMRNGVAGESTPTGAAPAAADK